MIQEDIKNLYEYLEEDPHSYKHINTEEIAERAHKQWIMLQIVSNKLQQNGLLPSYKNERANLASK